MAYHKRYHNIKELITTARKNHLPFDNAFFETLAFSPEYMKQWYEHVLTQSAGSIKVTRESLLQMFNATKERLAAALAPVGPADDPIYPYFGARQEYRVDYSIYHLLTDEVPDLNSLQESYDGWDRGGTQGGGEHIRSGSCLHGRL